MKITIELTNKEAKTLLEATDLLIDGDDYIICRSHILQKIISQIKKEEKKC